MSFNYFRNGKLHLVFEYVEKNLLEVLEERPSGLDVLTYLISRSYIFLLAGSNKEIYLPTL